MLWFKSVLPFIETERWSPEFDAVLGQLNPFFTLIHCLRSILIISWIPSMSSNWTLTFTFSEERFVYISLLCCAYIPSNFLLPDSIPLCNFTETKIVLKFDSQSFLSYILSHLFFAFFFLTLIHLSLPLPAYKQCFKLHIYPPDGRVY